MGKKGSRRGGRGNFSNHPRVGLKRTSKLKKEGRGPSRRRNYAARGYGFAKKEKFKKKGRDTLGGEPCSRSGFYRGVR